MEQEFTAWAIPEFFRIAGKWVGFAKRWGWRMLGIGAVAESIAETVKRHLEGEPAATRWQTESAGKYRSVLSEGGAVGSKKTVKWDGLRQRRHLLWGLAVGLER